MQAGSDQQHSSAQSELATLLSQLQAVEASHKELQEANQSLVGAQSAADRQHQELQDAHRLLAASSSESEQRLLSSQSQLSLELEVAKSSLQAQDEAHSRAAASSAETEQQLNSLKSQLASLFLELEGAKTGRAELLQANDSLSSSLSASERQHQALRD